VARDRLGLSQSDLTRVLGVGARSVRRWEMGEDLVPAGVWETLDTLRTEHDATVRELAAAVHVEDGEALLDVPLHGADPTVFRPRGWFVGAVRRMLDGAGPDDIDRSVLDGVTLRWRAPSD
jgi:DNA-binding XRE family transcriptional regulator